MAPGLRACFHGAFAPKSAHRSRRTPWLRNLHSEAPAGRSDRHTGRSVEDKGGSAPSLVSGRDPQHTSQHVSKLHAPEQQSGPTVTTSLWRGRGTMGGHHRTGAPISTRTTCVHTWRVRANWAVANTVTVVLGGKHGDVTAGTQPFGHAAETALTVGLH